MIYFVNALALAFTAVFWSRSSAINLFCISVAISLAMINGILAVPFVQGFLR